MQIELSLEEIKRINNWFQMHEMMGHRQRGDEDLNNRLLRIRAEAEELESMDLSDCAGGACKL